MTTETDTASAAALTVVRHTSSSASVIVPLSKSDTVNKLLLRGKGATSLELIAATDWEAHSVRAFLSGLRKKGRVIVREARKSGDLAYRIEAAAKPVADGSVLAAEATATSDATA